MWPAVPDYAPGDRVVVTFWCWGGTRLHGVVERVAKGDLGRYLVTVFAGSHQKLPRILGDLPGRTLVHEEDMELADAVTRLAALAEAPWVVSVPATRC
jgi:hypothetical protein